MKSIKVAFVFISTSRVSWFGLPDVVVYQWPLAAVRVRDHVMFPEPRAWTFGTLVESGGTGVSRTGVL